MLTKDRHFDQPFDSFFYRTKYCFDEMKNNGSARVSRIDRNTLTASKDPGWPLIILNPVPQLFLATLTSEYSDQASSFRILLFIFYYLGLERIKPIPTRNTA